MAELTVLNSEITKCLLKTHTKPKLSRSKAEQETLVIRTVVTIDIQNSRQKKENTIANKTLLYKNIRQTRKRELVKEWIRLVVNKRNTKSFCWMEIYHERFRKYTCIIITLRPIFSVVFHKTIFLLVVFQDLFHRNWVGRSKLK